MLVSALLAALIQLDMLRCTSVSGRKRETRVRFAHNEKDDVEYHQSMKQEEPTKSAAEMIQNINAKVGYY